MGGRRCRVLGTVMGPASVPTPSWAASPSQPELDLSLTAESLEGRPLGDICQGNVLGKCPRERVVTQPRWPNWAAVFEQALGPSPSHTVTMQQGASHSDTPTPLTPISYSGKKLQWGQDRPPQVSAWHLRPQVRRRCCPLPSALPGSRTSEG